MNDKNNYAENGVTLKEIWTILRNKINYFLISFFLIMVLGLLYLGLKAPIYSATVQMTVTPIILNPSKIEFPQEEHNPAGIITIDNNFNKDKNLIQNALNTLDLSQYKDNKDRTYDTFYTLTKQELSYIKINTDSDTHIVSITVKDKNPRFSANFANAIAKTYSDNLVNKTETMISLYKKLGENQKQRTQKDLVTAINNYSSFNELKQYTITNSEFPLLLNQMIWFGVEKSALQTKYNYNQDLLNQYIKKATEDSIKIPALSDIENDENIAELIKYYKSISKELFLYHLEKKYNSSNNLTLYPIFFNTSFTKLNLDQIELNITQLTSTQKKLEKELLTKIITFLKQNYNSNLNILVNDYTSNLLEVIKSNTQLNILEEVSQQYQSKIYLFSQTKIEATELINKINLLTKNQRKLSNLSENLEILSSSPIANTEIINKAIAANKPSSPDTVFILLVFSLIGLATGYCVCLIASVKDKTINNQDDLNNTVGENIPLLDWIPLVEPESINQDLQNPDNNNSIIASYYKPTSLQAQKYLNISSSLMYKLKRDNRQVLSIVSFEKCSGKSLAIANIGVNLAKLSSKVIILDCNFRNSSLLQYFGYSKKEHGLSEIIMKGAPFQKFLIQPIQDLPQLHLLQGGEANNSEPFIFTRDTFKNLIKELKKEYDFILIDAPSISFVSDVLSLCDICDSLILNVRANITEKSELKALITTLEINNDKIIGSLLNGFVPSYTDNGEVGNKKITSHQNKEKLLIQSLAKKKAIKVYKTNVLDIKNFRKYIDQLDKFINISK